MGIPANDGHPGLGYSQFWADDVYDTVVCRAQVMKFNVVLRTIFAQPFYLHARKLILDGLILIYRRHIVIWGSDGPVGILDTDASFLQIEKSYRRGHFVNEVLVYKKHIGTSRYGFDYVCIPDFIK